MKIAGQKMHDPNLRLRILLILLGGISALAFVLYWRTEYIVSQEYVEFRGSATLSSSKNTHKTPQPVRKDLKGYEDLYQ